jgi:hypothetical protein
MNIKSLLTRAAVPALGLGLLSGAALGLAGPASAATPSCGHDCVTPYVKTFGHRFVMDVKGGAAVQNAPIILWSASNSDPAEDFTPTNQGTVQDFRDAGLVSAAFNLHYHGLQAYELEYTPNGQGTGLCVGTWPGAPAAGFKLRLEPCGVGPWTVLAAGDPGIRGGQEYVTVLDAAGNNFSHPLAWSWPSINSAPTDQPRPVLNVQNLWNFSRGQIPDTMLWSAHAGVVGAH